jgi:uncharacterized protein YegP (UPF0339 family)
MPDVVKVWEDAGGTWRWTRKDMGNHEKVATSGEGYSTKGNAKRAAESVWRIKFGKNDEVEIEDSPLVQDVDIVDSDERVDVFEGPDEIDSHIQVVGEDRADESAEGDATPSKQASTGYSGTVDTTGTDWK